MKKPQLPKPTYFGRLRHWKLSELLAYEAALRGEDPPASDPAAERYLTARQVCERYGVSDMWIWRRLVEHDDALKPVA
jgi:predicted DNA-binding transcriptional regulator AlpA